MDETDTLKEQIFSTFTVFDQGFAILDTLAAVAFVAIGLSLIGFFIFRAFYIRFNKNYRPIMAKIVKSEITEEFRRSQPAGMMYTPDIEYEYEVDGAKYRSSQLFIVIESFSSPNKIEIMYYLKKFTLGSVVPVFVHSRFPHKSYLDSNSPGVGLELFLGIIFTAGGIVIFYVF